MKTTNRALYFLALVFLLTSVAIPSNDYIRLGDSKQNVLSILGTPDSINKFDLLNQEIWRYSFSSITFKNGRVYEYSGAHNLKIKLMPSSALLNAPDFITLGSNFDEVLSVLGTPDSISKLEYLNQDIWRYGFSSITFKNGRVNEYSGANSLRVKLLPKRVIGEKDQKPISFDLGSSFDDVLYVLGTPDSITKLGYLSQEIWRYGFSSITFSNGRVNEYSGGQSLKIAINPNGKYFSFDESSPIQDYYNFNQQKYSVEGEENLFSIPVLPSPEIKSQITSDKLKDYINSFVKDYYGNLHPFIAENGSYYGEISKLTGRPKSVYVRGYFRKDGTYVRSHFRSSPRRK